MRKRSFPLRWFRSLRSSFVRGSQKTALAVEFGSKQLESRCLLTAETAADSYATLQNTTLTINCSGRASQTTPAASQAITPYCKRHSLREAGQATAR